MTRTYFYSQSRHSGIEMALQIDCMHFHRNCAPFRKPATRASGGCSKSVGVVSATSPWSFLPWNREASDRRLAQELVQEVTSRQPDLARLREIVEQLTETSVSFKQSLLSPGPWEVVYTSGPLLWQKLTNSGAVNSRKKRNKAYQDFDGSSGTVINYGELLGEKVYVTAEGTFKIEGQSTRMPLDLEASIERGALHILGRTLPLPISGTGSVQLAYTDGEAVRIFRSGNGSVSVQVKRELLQ